MSDRANTNAIRLNTKPLITGAVLVGAGGIVALVGMVVSGTAASREALRWARQLDPPPTELARGKWEQVKSASAAGAGAWRDMAAVADGRS